MFKALLRTLQLLTKAMVGSQGRFTSSVPRGESITLKVQGRFVLGETTFVADTDQQELWIVLKPIKP